MGAVNKTDSSLYVSTEGANYDTLGEGWVFLISFIRWFPDFLLDLFRSESSDYGDETLLQRMVIRAKARYQYVDITGARGMTKTNSTFKEEMVELLVWAGTRLSYYGPSYKQMAKVGSQAFRQIEKDYPALAKHFDVGAESVDRFQLTTPFHSDFSITAMRGDNVHKVVAEEYAQEGTTRFDYEEFKRVVLPAIRLQYMVKGKPDNTYVRFKQHTITSAGRRQNHAYETRCRHYQMMERGESAFVMDVPFDVPLLLQMRPVQWAESLRTSLTPDEWAREMESRYTGSDENPVISDSTLTESRCLTTMEEHHCCKDYNNKLDPKDVFYIIGYDVSYADGANNAKCACVVLKCTKHSEFMKRDKYLKQLVWVNDWSPKNAMEQAKKLKSIWYRFTAEGSMAYIAIDAWQYGTGVVQSLMMDLGDGLDALCIFNHEQYVDYELKDSIPCIYPVKAGGSGVTDPDAEMIRNCEIQFENHNVQLLTSNYSVGIEAYKKLHRIKDDRNDYAIYLPYKKTNELVGQIQNLKKIPSGSGFTEKRISNRIQRDSWSALKYALRLAQKLERTNLMKEQRHSDWDDILKNIGTNGVDTDNGVASSRMITSRQGGRLF